MKEPEILIAEKGDSHCIKVVGRATIAISAPVRQFVQDIERDEDNKGVSINLADCEGMDSTFMGILAMMALKLRKKGITVKIIKSGNNKKLLDGLGLSKLFEYLDDDDGTVLWKKIAIDNTSSAASSETVLDAHRTLMEADEGNITKFKNVVDMVEREIKK